MHVSIVRITTFNTWAQTVHQHGQTRNFKFCTNNLQTQRKCNTTEARHYPALANCYMREDRTHESKIFFRSNIFFSLANGYMREDKNHESNTFFRSNILPPPPSFPFSSIRLAIKYVHGTTRYTSNYFVCARVCVCVHARCCVHTNANSSAVLQDYSLSQTRIHLHSE